MKTKTEKIMLVVALYLLAQIIADVTAFKMVNLFGLAIPAGSMIYALTFTNRDLAHKQIGYKNTKKLIWLAAIVNVAMAGFFMISIWLPAPEWFQYSKEYALVMGIMPRVAVASIIAELVSQLLDTHFYQKWWEKHPKAPQWTRVLVSNSIALPVDSAVFAIIAFAGSYTINQLVMMILGQVLFKMVLTVVGMPLIYIIPQNPEYSLSETG
jgi:uncharacterized integral membrane protein (TIGR00697 family)